MAYQRKDQDNPVYIIRGPGGDREEVTIEIPALSGRNSEAIGKAEVESITDAIVHQVKSSETQTFIAGDDSDDGDSEVGVDLEETGTEVVISDPIVLQNIIKYRKEAFKERQRPPDAPEKKLYACKYCDKLFGRTSDCTRHEQGKCAKMAEKQALVEINAKESQAGKLQITQKVMVGEAGEDNEASDGKTWAEILSDACVVGKPANTTFSSLKAIYHCPKCDKKLKGSSNFYSHYRTVHEKYRPFSCEVCKCQFGTRTNYTNHQIAVHTRKCDGCSSYVAETEPWADGMTKHHERMIQCGSCNKVVVFISGNKLRQPGMKLLKPIIPIKPYKERNRKTPQKESYACEVCGKLFYKLFDCRRHQQKHADGKNNICEICGRQFQHRTTLQQHRKIHDDDFVPPHCSICNKDFQQKKSFNEHMVRKHGIDVIDDKNPFEAVETGVQYVTVATTETVDAFGNTVIQM